MPPEGGDAKAAINRHLFTRRMETNRKLMRRGFGLAALGVGLVAAGIILAPVIPVAAAALQQQLIWHLLQVKLLC